MGHADIYDPIEDWSREGRRVVADQRGHEIRMLLDFAFSRFVDDEAVGLSAFGFHADDPITEAVEWSVDRFVSADLQPDRLQPGSRSFRLFTEVRFWLCQKVGRSAYDRILASSNVRTEMSGHILEGSGDPSSQEDGAINEALLRFGHELASTLRALGARTCADIVGFWLEGTASLRREWFGWRDRAHVSEGGSRLSKKQRSFYAHDAMFRFLCCFRDLLAPEPADASGQALVLTALSPCDNAPPYRVSDRDVVSHLMACGVTGSRDVARLRKEGARGCLCRFLKHVTLLETGDSDDRLCAELMRRSIGPTTLHSLGVEDDVALRERIDSILRPVQVSP